MQQVSSVDSAFDNAIDRHSLEARCLGNLDLVERVLAKFETQLAADLDTLERAIEAHDLPTAALISHRIKGMSANVGAHALHEHADEAERLALADSPEALPNLLANMQRDRPHLAAPAQQHSS